jgi:hypothetical protein
LEGIAREDIFGFLLIIGSLLVSAALVEGTLRLVPGLLPEGARLRLHWRGDGKPWYVPHPYIGHLHISDAEARAKTARPGIVSTHIDRWGFRNTDPWPQQAEIVAVGDSMTYSQTVNDDQAWTTLLDHALPHSRVLNLGLNGGAPQQYLRIYETFGIERTPKVLLVGQFLGNDLWEADKFNLWWNAGGQGGFPEFGHKEAKLGIQGWINHVMNRTYLFALLQDLHDSYRSGRFMQGTTMTLPDGGRIQLVPSQLATWARLGQPGRREFTLILETLERIHAIAEQHETHVLVLFFPMKEEVYLPLLGVEAHDLSAPFIPELAKRGIAYLNLGPVMRQQAAAGKTLYWEVDGHPNPRGYALIMEAVLSHLKENARRYGLRDWEESAS